MKTLSSSLSSEQQYIRDLVILKKKSVLISSKAGTGKTYLQNDIYESLLEEGYAILCCAFTGRAASLLPHGLTMSRASGIRRGDIDFYPLAVNPEENSQIPVLLKKKPIRQAIGEASDIWQQDKLAVIIDEAGQLSSENFRLFVEAGLLKRNDKGEPIIWIVSGDFGQFKPVSGTQIYNPGRFETIIFSGDKTNQHSNGSQSNKQTEIELPSLLDELNLQRVSLKQVQRQKDPTYLRALDWLYYGIAVHPLILMRLEETPPEDAPRFMFNNREVKAENEAYVAKFRQEHPQTRIYKFEAITSNLSDKDKEDLLPITEAQYIGVGMKFTLTKNIGEGAGSRQLIATNGETVTIIAVERGKIQVRNKNGVEFWLSKEDHFSFDKTSNKSFIQLPGYVGKYISLYKSQGATIDKPAVFGAWQWWGQKKISLKNQPGALYVICSRPTELDYLYFDTEKVSRPEARGLLVDSINVNQNTLNYLLDGKRPTWLTDPTRQFWVLEIDKVECIDGNYRFTFIETQILEATESVYELDYNSIGTRLNSNEDERDHNYTNFNLLAKIWLEDYSKEEVFIPK